MLLTFVSIVSFYSCQTDDEQEHDHFHEHEGTVVSEPFSYFKELPSVIDKAISRQNVNTSRNGTGDLYDFDIDSTIVTRVAKKDVYYYTMAITRETEREGKFENLVIVDDGETKSAYIVSYFPDAKYFDRLSINNHAPYVGGIAVTAIDPTRITARGSNCVQMITFYCGNGRHGTLAGPGCYNNRDGGAHVYAGVTEVCETSSLTIIDLPVKNIDFDPASGTEPGGGGGGGGGGGQGEGSYLFYDEDPPYVVTYPGPRIVTQPILPRNLMTPTQYFIQSLDATQLQFWNSANGAIQSLFINYLSQGSVNDSHRQQFAKEMVSAMAELEYIEAADINALGMTLAADNGGYIEQPFDEAHLAAIAPYAEVDLYNSANWHTWQMYFTFHCVVIKMQHPDWPNGRVYLKATLEMVHIALDILGLVPGIGEIADLTNGLIYTIQGDGVNAAISTAAAIPFVGWGATGTKYAYRTVTLFDGSYTALKWVKNTQNIITFGNRGQLRRMLNLLPGDPRQAHHIIPWEARNHPAIQKAAGSTDAFHLNDAFNGIPLNTSVHSGSHQVYNNKVLELLNDIPESATPQETYDAIVLILHDIKTAMYNNPTTHINDLIF